MNWDAIGAIGELAGAVAVVASLVYVATQIRHSTRESQRSFYFSVKTGSQQFRAMIAQDPEVARIYREGLKDLGALNEDDRWRFGALMQHEFSVFEDAFRLRQDTILQDVGGNLRWTMSRPGARTWWAKGREIYHPDFQRYVDALVAEEVGISSGGRGD